VRITRIRDLLGAGPARTSPTRPAVDEALRRLGRGTGAALAPQEDQKNLTGADRRDAVRIGGQDMHLLMIEN
jgi:hypothetical protein